MKRKLINYEEPNLFYDNNIVESELDSFFDDYYANDFKDIDKENNDINNKFNELSNEELCVSYQKGNEEALGKLIIKNEKLIYSRVEKYKNTYMQDLSDEDLFQEGSIGMITAANRFDINLGYKFTTYATHWIDQSIIRKIENEGFTIRLPVHVFENVNRLRREINEVEFLELDNKEKLKILEKYTGYSVEEIYNLNRIYSNILNSSSLNLLVRSESSGSSSEGRVELINLIYDKSEKSPVDIVFNKIFRQDMIKILNTLDNREKDIIKRRFGFIGNNCQTLEEIGEIYGLTRERIRQIEKGAIDKLKKTNRSEKIKDYLYEY